MLAITSLVILLNPKKSRLGGNHYSIEKLVTMIVCVCFLKDIPGYTGAD